MSLFRKNGSFFLFGKLPFGIAFVERERERERERVRPVLSTYYLMYGAFLRARTFFYFYSPLKIFAYEKTQVIVI